MQCRKIVHVTSPKDTYLPVAWRTNIISQFSLAIQQDI